MAIARTLKWYLESHGVEYEILPHPRTRSSRETAEAAHIWGDQLAKSVLLEDERGYVMAVLPASHRIAMTELNTQLRRELELATEAEIERIFADCETGAVPPLGAAYGIPAVVDDSLMHLRGVYFEAGDHEDLVYVSGDDFAGLLEGSQTGHFSRPA